MQSCVMSEVYLHIPHDFAMQYSVNFFEGISNLLTPDTNIS